MRTQRILDTLRIRSNSSENSRIGIIARSLMQSPLGSCVGLICVICGAISILCGCYAVNFWLVSNGQLAIFNTKPGYDPIVASAVTWCGIQIGVILLIAFVLMCLHGLIKETIDSVHRDLHKYEERNETYIDEVHN